MTNGSGEKNLEGQYKGEDKLKWSSRLDFFITLLGYSFGLPDIWRLPYLVYRNGGGAFLFPYVILMLLCGTPLYFLEIALAQYSGKGPWKFWDICPLFRGFAIAVTVVNVMFNIIDVTVRSWILEYLVNSFRSEIPWVSCDNWWNTPACISVHSDNHVMRNVSDLELNLNLSVHRLLPMNTTAVPSNLLSPISSTEEFFRNRVVRQSEGLDDVGDINGVYVIYHFVVRLVVLLACIKSVKSLGKMMYVTAMLPVVFTIIIWIRALMLPGASDGMLYFITPDFSKIWSMKVWIEAAFMTFYTLGPGWGGLIMMGCHNTFRTNCLRAAMVSSCGTLLYGILNGLVVFSVVGVMAREADISVSQTIESGGFSIGFVAFPKALSYFPFPQVWCVLFYLVLLLPGIDALTVELEPVILVLDENFESLRKRRILVLAVFSSVALILGLPFTTQAGVYLYQLMDWYISVFSIMFICLMEAIIFSWIYGSHRVDRDLMLMLGRKMPAIIRVSCAFIMPVFLSLLLLISLYTYRLPTLGQYTYPAYANVFGWCVSMASTIPIFVYGVVTILKTPGTIKQRLASALRNNTRWKPADDAVLPAYRASEKEARITWKSILIYNLTGRGGFDAIFFQSQVQEEEIPMQ